MPTILEPIGAGLTVALINKFFINNDWLWRWCAGCRENHCQNCEDISDDNSSSTSAIDTVEVHAHF